MSRARLILRRVLFGIGGLLALLILAGIAGVFWLRGHVAAALPALDGEAALPGLTAPVTVEQDALGVPTFTGVDRVDISAAVGYLHAQNRFFQMDIMRRDAAGELAELLGPALVSRDRINRVHRFRDLARRVMAAAPEDLRARIEAYTVGVNAGLAALGASPFEYLALRAEPEPWAAEDSVLAILAMFLALHDDQATRDTTLGVMSETLPGPLFEFLATKGTEWDAPITGDPLAMPPIPGPDVFDLKRLADSPPRLGRAEPASVELPEPFFGSNNWAVAGKRTATGAGLLANDMHLGLTVPNTWYRASFVWPDPLAPGGTRRVTGVTLPGAPAIVVGSNGRIAWGFTNSYGDWTDLVLIDKDPADADSYLTPDGPRKYAHHPETIHVKGQADETLDVVETVWGPLLADDYKGRARALRWTAHHEEAVDFDIMRLETAADVNEAVVLAARVGAPPQNFVVADAEGHIGWTIMGAIPRREGGDTRLPTTSSTLGHRWNGWLSPDEYPRVIDPQEGLIWSANARVVDGEMLAKVGDGGFDLGARAGQIRDDLRQLTKATEQDMLRVQLDDRGLFLTRWRELLLSVLTPEAIAADPRRAEMRRFVESWGGRASVDSVGYRMVRGFRSYLSQQVFDAVTIPCRKADPNFRYLRVSQSEGPLWAIVSQRPANLLDPKFKTWDEQLLSGVDAALDFFTQDGAALAGRTWGERNMTRIKHPLSIAVPALGRWLDMRSEPLPGDSSDMPRVQSPSEGASERMAVSPGREEQGYFHMPCGQSGNPMSPHYADGHAAWARGEATSFLPGPTTHTLTLKPGAAARR